MTHSLIQEAIEAAETQDICGNHNSADLLRRLARELEAERKAADAFYVALKAAMLAGNASTSAMRAHAKRREAGE